MFLGAPYSPAFWHLAVSAANTQWDAVHSRTGLNTAENRQWWTATKLGDGQWTVEARVPLTAEEKRIAPEGIAFNIGREDLPAQEYTSWSGVSQGFLDASEFGRVILAPASPRFLYENDFEKAPEFAFWQAASPRVNDLEQAAAQGFLTQGFCGLSGEGKAGGKRSLKLDVSFLKSDRNFTFAAWRGPSLDLKIEKPLYVSGYYKVQEGDRDGLRIRIAAVVSGVPKGKDSDTTHALSGGESVPAGAGGRSVSYVRADQILRWSDVTLRYPAILIQRPGGFKAQRLTLYVDGLAITSSPLPPRAVAE